MQRPGRKGRTGDRCGAGHRRRHRAPASSRKARMAQSPTQSRGGRKSRRTRPERGLPPLDVGDDAQCATRLLRRAALGPVLILVITRHLVPGAHRSGDARGLGPPHARACVGTFPRLQASGWRGMKAREGGTRGGAIVISPSVESIRPGPLFVAYGPRKAAQGRRHHDRRAACGEQEATKSA